MRSQRVKHDGATFTFYYFAYEDIKNIINSSCFSPLNITSVSFSTELTSLKKKKSACSCPEIWKVITCVTIFKIKCKPDSHQFCYGCCGLLTKSCQTFCNPLDCSPPGSSLHRISQIRILEWIAISFSRRYSRRRGWTDVSYNGRQILHCWAPREAWTLVLGFI